MTTMEAEARPSVAAIPALTLPLTIAATFLSAALLFSVQPMFTKLVLPILGGSPSVWSIAMVFFQALLLCGYAYAHLLARLAPRLALLVHLSVMVAAFALLPMAIPAGWVKAPAGYEAIWLLGLFGLVVGLPFFALSANGPLLQAWFARTSHKDAKDPYFLYSASNIGSFAALLLYPVAIEPVLKLKEQTAVWAAGFAALAVLIGLAGWQMLRAAAPVATVAASAETVTWRQRMTWMMLALVPSGLLVAVTAHISTDVAAVPLLWVLPLALFLLTFVLVFSSKPGVPAGALPFLQVAGTALVLASLVFRFELWIAIPLNLATFFVSAMVCHGALYARRPGAARLTEFYLFMSLGGCIGGLFAGLLAPQIFSTVLEYPILLVAALFCRPQFLAASGWVRAGVACAVLMALGWFAAMLMPPAVAQAGVVGALALMMVVAWKSPAQGGPAAIALALSVTLVTYSVAPVESFRSFFGVHRLVESPDGAFTVLMSGTTVHGAARRNETGRPEPVSYYTSEGAMGLGIAAIREAQGGALRSVSVIGLGSGSLACHGWGAESWRFYEIDPDVVALATERFPFLAGCAPGAPIILGDARLTLAETTETNDLIVLDAFSSDSIPAHLITADALAIYRDRLVDDGAIIVHISNRNLDLSRILARTAAEVGLVAYIYDDQSEEPRTERFRLRSVAMVLARNPADIGSLATDWTRVEPDMARRPWTDDFSNILEAILDKVRYRA